MRVRGPIAPSIFKRHPLTGQVIEPVGVVGNKVVWPIMGGAPDGDDDDDDDKDDKTGDSGAGNADDKADKSGGDSGTGDDKSADELENLRKRMTAADQRADKAEKALKAIEDAKKDDLTKANESLEEAQSTIEELQSTVRTLRLQNAFLTANKHTWHDPDTALDLAERQGYLEDAVDDKGEVNKVTLGKALDRLAKEKPFLVNSGGKKDDEPGEPSGEPAGGRSDNGKDDKAKRDNLRKRFPVLNR